MIVLLENDPITRFNNDSLSAQITVINYSLETPGPFDLTGATLSVKLSSGTSVYIGSTQVTDATNGVCVVSWAKDVITSFGRGVMQLRVEKNGESEIVISQPVIISRSI